MFDIGIINGLVIDGLGSKGYHANVYVTGDRIAAITRSTCKAVKVIDAEDMTVCPALIDVHSHSDLEPFYDNPMESSALQGVGTEIIGNCGISPYPSAQGEEFFTLGFAKQALGREGSSVPLEAGHSVASYAQSLSQVKTAINLALMVGHGALRISVIGPENREGSAAEINQMCELLDIQLSQGALGLSLGLIYPPSSHANREELLALARVVHRHDKILSVHLRNEADGVFEAVDEMMSLVGETGVKLHISHLKLMGTKVWNQASKLLERLVESDLDISCDQYPYMASNTSLTALVPDWAQEGAAEHLTVLLKQRDQNLLEGIEKNIISRGGAESIIISNTRKQLSSLEGRSLADIARDLGTSASEAAASLMIHCQCKVDAIFFSMCERDVLEFLANEEIMVASDGIGYSFDEETLNNTSLHPRNFSTFSTALELIRLNGLMSQEQAVRKMTSLPAKRFGIRDRGVLREGYFADILVMDHDHIENASTYEHPAAKAQMVKHLLIGGKVVVEDGNMTLQRPGRAILVTE